MGQYIVLCVRKALGREGHGAFLLMNQDKAKLDKKLELIMGDSC